MNPVFFLFDVDGVLVEPRGYRQAFYDTTAHFLNRLRIPAATPEKRVYERFESIRVTSEWDMIPFCIAVAVESVLADGAALSLPDTLEEIAQNAGSPLEIVYEPDYEEAVSALGKVFKGGGSASLFLLGPQGIALRDTLFPRFQQHALFQSMFSNTNAPGECATTGFFQNYALGSDVFAECYAVSAPVQVDSYLRHYDRVLVDPDLSQMLAGTPAIRRATLTARPSMPPKSAPVSRVGFSAEAEQALRLLEWEGVPAMGFGCVQTLEMMHGVSAYQLLKPQPLQALASLAAAVDGDVWSALEWAFHVWKDGADRLFPGLPKSLEIHVFEDSPVGMQAVKNALPYLQRCGVATDLRLWGIARNPHKVKALEAQGAQVVETVNDALRCTGLL